MNPELADLIGVGTENGPPAILVGRVGAIDEEQHLIGTGAIGRHSYVGNGKRAGSARQPRTGLMVECVDRSRRQQLQLLEIAAVERQVDNPLLLDQMTHGGLVGLQHGSRGRYLHGLADLSNLKRNVHSKGGIHVQLHTGNRGRSKPLLDCLHFIEARAKVGEGKHTGRSGGFGDTDVGFQAAHGHADVGDDRARRIGNKPNQGPCRAALTVDRRNGGQATEQHK